LAATALGHGGWSVGPLPAIFCFRKYSVPRAFWAHDTHVSWVLDLDLGKVLFAG
jgi:hypothetical protein